MVNIGHLDEIGSSCMLAGCMNSIRAIRELPDEAATSSAVLRCENNVMSRLQRHPTAFGIQSE